METEAIQLRGGVECTVNRVGDRHFNQLELSGHGHREADLERFAELGIRTLRFPLLWETLAPQSLDHIDWSWPEDRKSTRLNSSHVSISYAVFCLKKKKHPRTALRGQRCPGSLRPRRIRR